MSYAVSETFIPAEPHRCELPHHPLGTVLICQCGQHWLAVEIPTPTRGQMPAQRGWFGDEVWGWKKISRRRARRLIEELRTR